MYRGKFQSDKREGTPVYREPSPVKNTRTSVQQPSSRQTASQRTAQAQPQRSAQVQRTAQAQRTAQQREVPQAAPQRRGPRVGGIIFYTLYFLLIFVFCAGTWLATKWLQGWLVDYEASQPTIKSQEVFDQLFANPDWAALYKSAGIQDTPYEGVDAYVAYMQEKAAGKTLTYTETSAGTSGDKKYLVKLDDEKVASFTLSGGTEHVTDIPDWTLGTVELFFDRAEGYKIQKMDGHTAYVNGAPLDDSFTIQIATTKADQYLPIGTTGVKTCIQQIDGLMARPTVTINDQAGNPMEVSYDEEAGMFIEQTEANTISDALRQRSIEAMESYGKFLLNIGNRATVATYFDPSGDAYKYIMSADRSWTKSGSGQKFMNEEVSEYVRYSDTLFSVRVSMTMTATRPDGTVKEFPIDYTLFFTRKNDKWMIYDMIAGSIQIPVGQVRLTFMDGDTQLSTGFYDTETEELLTPVVSVPEGKRLSWVRKDRDANGRQQLTVVFTPDETGLVQLASGTILEPMTLYTYIEDAAAAAVEGGVS